MESIRTTYCEEIELEGVFNLKQPFESVPDACHYYENELGDQLTRKILKDRIKKYSTIHENGEKLDWEVINKRINSWVDHESSKPNRQKIPHK
ncbi:MAG: hypothetical protein U5K72_16080 [Balneolaceae bacterium]|nr:hypothetical protein [Balneolaceae bacterium]